MNIPIASLFLLLWSAVGAAATPSDVLEAVDEVRAPGENFGFSLDLVHKRPGKNDTHFRFEVRVKDSVKSLVEYQEPATARGKKLLMLGQNMWVYVPGTRRPIRISPQQQLLGQVSNADVARVVFSIDYKAEGMTRERFEGTDAYRLKLVARSRKSPYRKIELVVGREDSRPLEARFYALSGRLLKTVRYSGYRQVLGRMRPMRLDVQDAIHKGESTEMRYSNMQQMTTPESHFQKDYLPRL